MVGLGTRGGQLRADGSSLESGIHLRWQMGETIGFPPRGFDIYRRQENLDLFVRCGELLKRDDGGISWVPNDPSSLLVDLTASGESIAVRGCDQRTPNSVRLTGQQKLRIAFREPARHVLITFDRRTSPTPAGTAFWMSPDGLVAVGRETAQRQPTNEWILQLFADQIDEVVLSGEDMIVCEICFLLVKDGYDFGWDPLPLNNPTPIYLPITHPVWGSPHPHSPDDQAEAEFRLPAGLTAAKSQTYADGFADDLHEIINDLVGTEPQHLYMISDEDVTSGAELNWPGLQLLKLTALDPNLARILGLYWHDQPPDADRYYDYRLVGHYGDTKLPGRRFTYSQLVVGTRYGTVLEHEGIRYVSPNPIEVTEAERAGSPMSALLITRTISNAPLSISLSQSSVSVTLYVSAEATVTARAYLGSEYIFEEEVSAGVKTILLQDLNGIDTLVIETDGDLTIFEIVLRATTETLNDVVYVTFHHRMTGPKPLHVPSLEQPALIAARTGLDEAGVLREHQTSVGLRWDLPLAGAGYLKPGSPVFYHVQRADRGAGAQPDPTGTAVLLNERAPVLVTENLEQPAGAPARNNYYIDRNVADGWYSYQVRGIDLFGRLGDWSQAKTVQALDRLPPPPPQGVTALYLESTDPWLSKADRDWATANGPGLRVNWEWPGMLRLQAPDIEPAAAEFRIYSILGELNQLNGRVLEVTRRGHSSKLTTNITWNGAEDELAGESVRVGENFFPVTGNSSGANCVIEVTNLTLPELVPAPDPCTLVFGRDRSYWTDYAITAHWEKRLHVEPVVETPIVSGQVVRVVAFADSRNALFSRPGATHTVTTDQPLTDRAGVLVPGALLCEGVVYQAYGHTLGNKLKIHIVAQESPTDSLVLVTPTANASFLYYPGRLYETLIAGFTLEANNAQGSAVAVGRWRGLESRWMNSC